MSLYEITDVILSISGQSDTLFSYWISASFAVIVSSYIGKTHYNFSITLSISILYLLASFMFLARFYSMSTIATFYADGASELLPPDFVDSIPLIGFTRAPTFVIGFFVTEYYLWHSYLKNKADSNADT